jgi:hypothetical protein
MTRGVFWMTAVVMLGCSADPTTQGVDPTSEGGVLEGGGSAGSTMSNQESGSVIDMPGNTDGPVPTCSDGIQNGDESDVDCGGFCSPCPLNKVCRAHSDCASVHCVNTQCLECAPNTNQCSGNKPSTCTDGKWVVAMDDCSAGCDLNTGLCVVGSE